MTEGCPMTEDRHVIGKNAFAAVASLLIGLAPTMVGAQDGVTEVDIHVDDGYPPFSYIEDGEPKGIYITILEGIFDRVDGYEVNLKPIPWARGKAMMEKGDGFALTPAFFHGHDWPYLHPYSLPYHVETIRVVCNEAILSGGRKSWPEGFKNATIGNVQGFSGWGGAEFHEMVANGEVQYEELPNTDSLVKVALRGRVDCILIEETAFNIKHKEMRAELGDDVVSLRKGPIANSDPIYIGYSKPAREAGTYPFMFDFMQKVDSAIYQMKKSGAIQRILLDQQ